MIALSWRSKVAAAGLMLMSLAGSGSAQTMPDAVSALPRPLTPREELLASSGNQFSLALMRRVNDAQRDVNIFISPFSVSMALGVALNGAVGQTASEMRRALMVPQIPQASINGGVQGLVGLLRSIDTTTQLRIANAIAHRRELPMVTEFLETARMYYGAEIHALDFESPDAPRIINDWASRNTNGKIPNVVGKLDPDDALLILNAVYFKGSWRLRFDPKRTVDTVFRAQGGAVQRTKLMRQYGDMRYLETPEVQAVELLYGNGVFSMMVVLPREGRDVNALVGGMTEASWSAWSSGFREMLVDLHLPKLTLRYKRTLTDDLKALGMDLAFREGAADFSGMSRSVLAPYISEVVQHTFVDIHEEGTEAAAVTSVSFGVTSAPKVARMRVDRPFIFAIRERFSGTILFMGKIVQMPAAEFTL